MTTSILPARVNVKSFEETRLALQRMSDGINRLDGTNPFTVTFTQATNAEAKGGGIQATTAGQWVVSDGDSDFSAFQPGTDNYMLRANSVEDQGLEWRSPANVLSDIGAAAAATAVTAAAALTANALAVGDGSRGLTTTTITVDGSQNIANVGSFSIQNGGDGMTDHNQRAVLKPGVLASAGSHNFLTVWNTDTAVAPRIAATGGGSNIGIDFYDTGPNELLTLASVASAVGYLEVTNAADGNPVLLTAQTSTTNAGMTLGTSGSGAITLNAPTTLGGDLACAAYTLDNWAVSNGIRDGNHCRTTLTTYGSAKYCKWGSQKANGSEGTPTTVSNGNVICRFNFSGYDGSAFHSRAYIQA
ncbi:MAG: hypothetical protein ACYTG0_42370, partial [Planctomycetota bacterium]